MTAPPVPPALASLAEQRGVHTDAWALRGTLDLRIDARTRIKLLPGRRPNEVMLEARLGALPAAHKECEALLARVMLRVTAGASDQLGTIAVCAAGDQLLLQAMLDGADADRFDAGVETFLNELDRWNAVVGAKRP